MTKLIALLAALLLTLTACGGDGGSGSDGGGEDSTDNVGGADSAEDAKAKKNIAEGFVEEEGTPFDQRSATCFADRIVDEVGVAKLQEYKLLDDSLATTEDVQDLDMSESDAGKTADAFTDCVDVEKFFAEALAAGAEEIPAEVADCLNQALDEDKFNEVMKATFMGDDAAAQQAMAPALQCMMQGVPGAEPSP